MFQSCSPVVVSRAHHRQCAEEDPRHETEAMTIDQEDHQEDTVRRQWVVHDEVFLPTDVRDRRPEDMETGMAVGVEEEEAEVDSVAVEMMGIGLGAPCLARDPDHLDAAHHIHDRGPGAHHQGTAEVATFEGATHPREVAVVAGGVPATIPTGAGAGLGAGAGVADVDRPGDESFRSKMIDGHLHA